MSQLRILLKHVTAADTTQPRVTQHDIANMENSCCSISFETVFTRKLALMANKQSNSLYSGAVN